MSGRVTASHTTAMHSYNNAYAYRLINNIARAGLHMVTNPLDNAVLQGRFDTGPIRRGHTRVKQLLEAGVNVCIGHDSVMDPWYPLGYGDPLQAAFVLAHFGQMSGDAELRRLFDMITVNPAAALGVPTTGCAPAARPTWWSSTRRREADALRLVAPRTAGAARPGAVVPARPARHGTVGAWRRAPRRPRVTLRLPRVTICRSRASFFLQLEEESGRARAAMTKPDLEGDVAEGRASASGTEPRRTCVWLEKSQIETTIADGHGHDAGPRVVLAVEEEPLDRGGRGAGTGR